MNKLFTGIAIGMVTAVVLIEGSPEIKNAVDKLKNKMLKKH